ncbi:hypothetical protein EVAR_96816_1 [Eumeta japonica]|uniref:HAT C-terminal dimerisation domain-containing protein n=1 Tax=Eumeta variegata TaxID=151549 RepID=A0A4C1WDK8_EUMVA|nr:hypothetical protein EVAR_96816_1 [Eumeta japonica]
MAKCRAVWNLCARSPKACEIYLKITGKSPTSPCPTRWNSYYDCITDILKVQETINEVLRKLGLAVLKEIEVQFLIEYINTSKPISEAIRSLEDSSTTSTDGNSSTCTDLETLQYLRDEDTSLNIINIYPTIKKVFLRYNTCLPSSAPVERLFSYGGMIMRPHRRNMSDTLFEELVILKSLINKEYK